MFNFEDKRVDFEFTEVPGVKYDVEELIQIDVGNLVGEMLTFPVVIQRIGLKRVQMENAVEKHKHDLNIEEAKLRLLEKELNPKFTVTAIDDTITSNAEIKKRRAELISLNSQLSIIKALYRALESKDTKLNQFLKSLPPDDMRLEEVKGHINGVLLKNKLNKTDGV